MQNQWRSILVMLVAMTVMVIGGCGGGGGGSNSGDSGGGTASYSITGAITVNGTALAGVVVTLSGSSSATVTTDSSGNYSFSSIQNGSYTVTPVLTGYTFTPATIAVTVNGTNLTGKNFTAATSTASTYSISGTITNGGSALVGVTVTLSGSGSTTAITDSSGNYTFSGAQNGSYTITPSKAGYGFTPANLSVTVNSSNISGQNFTATATTSSTYSISGTITTGGAALAGVTINTSGGSATTDSSGNYIINSLANGSYLLTPTKAGYTFAPTSLSVSVSSANLTGKNFTAIVTPSNTTTGAVQLPKTGQTSSYVAGDDGALQKGVAWPTPRFTDNGNGTITDNLTGLIWLKNVNCLNQQTWTAALTSANTLASGACGITDGSSAGQWRLPNINELESLVDLSQYTTISLPIGHPFTSVRSFYDYWSSSTNVGNATLAWNVNIAGGMVINDAKSSTNYVWPVRGGQ